MRLKDVVVVLVGGSKGFDEVGFEGPSVDFSLKVLRAGRGKGFVEGS